ncbi:TonB-dependent receptor plug domain-containing protein [Microbulbifer rhizosphaerae]|uniref:Iron complex outermembrane receptor protein n=1 Tax=Microbulbifer rhizosphaerae TaxID=1562603 RepID=A0A7W4WEF5_9GAMM|nr:TonB-dependent receptor [Microbulbifer rhizosphaerae]MBB3062749.1 iron complex outermembrane receptor protein [Microbulbifer rhizosphaerae]
MKHVKFPLLLTTVPIWAFAAAYTNAETTETKLTDSGPTTIEEIAVVGSRRDGRSVLDAPVPVDVIGDAEMKSQGSSDMLDVLTNVVPSYNVSREPISDAGTLVRPANLRGMPADNTLVLVNGKRRHRGAVIGEFVAGVNKGAQGMDISPLPGIAMKQVEVLRDGAAAQYGSDAIAGVLNFVLADDPEARQIQVRSGQYFEGDGAISEISGLFGSHLGQDGFATLAFEIKDTEATSRGIQDPGAQALVHAGNTSVPDPVVVWGTPEITDDYKIFVNSAMEVGNSSEIYAFGNFATRDTDGSFFYRHPQGRSGVYTFTDGKGTATPDDDEPALLVADLTPDDSEGCPTIHLTGVDNVLNDPVYQDQVANNPNCFAFNEIYPGGFTPRFGGTVTDSSFAAGIRGEWSNGMTYDFSASAGRSKLDYTIYNSVNASYGPNSPSSFDLGSQIQFERMANADFSYPVAISGLASDLNVAFGLQYHKEQFEIIAGQTESFAPGGFEDQGFSIGSNGFQGFSDDVAGTFNRDSYAGYLDLEADITDNFLLSGAMRFEEFDDFGSTFDGKIAARLDLTDWMSLRAAASTGFKAPTVGQSSLRRASTSFADGQLIEALVVPPTNAVAQFKGGEQLQPEESTSLSIGTVISAGFMDLTIDYFNIKVDDRIALTNTSITEDDRAALLAMGNAEAQTISEIQFFVNDFDTETQGVDIVASAPFESSAGFTDFTLAYNWTDTKVVNRGQTVSEARAEELEDFLPEHRATFTINHSFGMWNAMVRTNYYGETLELLFNDETLPVRTDPIVLVDAEVSAQLNDTFQVGVGAKNLFDTYPDKHEYGDQPGFLGAVYPLNSPAGLNGGFYYVRLDAQF